MSTAVQNIVFKPTQRYNNIAYIKLLFSDIFTDASYFNRCTEIPFVFYYTQCELKLDQNICSHHKYYLFLQQSLDIIGTYIT